MFVIYRFGLLVRVWFVSMMHTAVVPCFFGMFCAHPHNWCGVCVVAVLMCCIQSAYCLSASDVFVGCVENFISADQVSAQLSPRNESTVREATTSLSACQ